MWVPNSKQICLLFWGSIPKYPELRTMSSCENSTMCRLVSPIPLTNMNMARLYSTLYTVKQHQLLNQLCLRPSLANFKNSSLKKPVKLRLIRSCAAQRKQCCRKSKRWSEKTALLWFMTINLWADFGDLYINSGLESFEQNWYMVHIHSNQFIPTINIFSQHTAGSCAQNVQTVHQKLGGIKKVQIEAACMEAENKWLLGHRHPGVKHGNRTFPIQTWHWYSSEQVI